MRRKDWSYKASGWIKFQFIEWEHSLCTQGRFLRRVSRKGRFHWLPVETILHAVVLETFPLSDRRPDCNRYQFTADGWFLCIVSAIADKSVLALSKFSKSLVAERDGSVATSRVLENHKLPLLSCMMFTFIAGAGNLRSIVTVVG